MRIACSRCAKAPLRVIWEESFGRVYECDSCGMIVTENFQEEEEIWDAGHTSPTPRLPDS